MPSDPIEAIGEFLTAQEAIGLAALLEAGRHTTHALREVNAARREEAKRLMVAAGLGHTDLDRSLAVLHAIAGAKAVRSDLTPVWTMPGNEANVGHLTSEFHRLVQAARQSVTCATYNFETTSQMWGVLREASEQPGVVVTVYIDGDKADASKVKAQLPQATVYRSGVLADGKQVVSHAKFIVIDHAMLLLTSANFSFSAENRNIEFGLRIHDPALAESVETTMATKHGSLYELVTQ
jgi:phosphatidylserine/phosphatidylglycerophosphate/cardiolipin synthase-like enzyme